MTDFSKIINKAKEMEIKMRESQEKIKSITATGVSGSNSVRVTINGEWEMVKLEISDETLKEEKMIIEDLIVAAYNNAKVQLKSKTKEEITKAAGGFDLSSIKWPL
jgi:DNA-binding YbaB/EbfC family protein|tara:strand:- start:9 stop:326 length:318 start_codon:yes stop_codon:yes gene_type:complete